MEKLYSCFNDFNFIHLEMSFIARDEIFLPDLKGSSFRGVFGKVFKTAFCQSDSGACRDCSMKSSCHYSYVFETPLDSNAEIMRKYNNAPHPFIIIPPLSSKNIFKPSEKFNFQMIILGKACKFITMYINVFRMMGENGIGTDNGKFCLESVDSFDSENIRRKVYDSSSRKIVETPPEILASEIALNKDFSDLSQVIINYITPTRIQFNEKIVSRIDFHMLVRNLIRRFSQLYYFHIDHNKVMADYQNIISIAEKIKTVENNSQITSYSRYSNRQHQKMEMNGVTGPSMYQGQELSKFIPLLKLGEYINVGKGTSFGLGKFSVII